MHSASCSKSNSSKQAEVHLLSSSLPIFQHREQKDKDLEGGPELNAFTFISTNFNTDHYRMGEHLGNKSCPLNLLYGPVINRIIKKN